MQVHAVSATTAAEDLRYVWERSVAGGTFEPVAGFAGDTLLIAEAAGADAGRYRVSVTGALGSGTSAAVELRVANSLKVTGVSVWSQGSVRQGALAEGRDMELRVEAEGGGDLAYTWYRDGQVVEGMVLNGGTLRIASVGAMDAGQYQVEVSNLSGSVRSVPVSVEVELKPVVSLPARVSVAVGQTVSVLSEVVSATAVNYAWYRVRNGVPGVLAGETFEGLVIASAQESDAGRYMVEVSPVGGSAGVAQAFVDVEVVRTGGGVDGGGTGTPGGGTGAGGAQATERWWVFAVEQTGEEPPLTPVTQVWVYDRVQQQSAWVWRDGDGSWRTSVWAVEDQQVIQAQKGGVGAQAGVLTFEVDAARPGTKDFAVWDGFALSGETGTRGVPEELRGEYGEQGDGERRAVVLRWKGTQTSAAGGFGEMPEVLEWLRNGGGE